MLTVSDSNVSNQPGISCLKKLFYFGFLNTRKKAQKSGLLYNSCPPVICLLKTIPNLNFFISKPPDALPLTFAHLPDDHVPLLLLTAVSSS
jgi:hypothetical protein